MGSEFKGREERRICYAARDAYFECFEKLPEGADGQKGCGQLYANFEKTCGAKWTEHFIRRRKYLEFKERLEKEGVDSADERKYDSKKK